MTEMYGDDDSDYTIREDRIIGSDSEAWSADEFRQMIDAAIADVPEACRESIRITLENTGQWTSLLRLSYERPETDAERERDLRVQAIAKARQAEEDRRTYERLKAKFEPKGARTYGP